MTERERHDVTTLTQRIRAFRAADPSRCAVAAHPDAEERIKEALAAARDSVGDGIGPFLSLNLEPNHLGYNDGVIVPPEEFPVGTPAEMLRATAADRAPLRGTVRVVVVLVEFSDRQMGATADRFRDLFFSTGVIPTGSVREYYSEVSGGLVTIDGEVVGPYTLPLTMAQYAHGESGTGVVAPNAQTMARDAALAANADVNFNPYDNDGNGFVDAFVVVHAGSGAEQTLAAGDIWSHKWTVAGGALTVDATKIFAYLTVPEDALLGVCAHEVGHLLWGWPDLYDTDDSSEGVGNWCLMGGGSWNAGGDTPAHPCAFLKIDQGWAAVTNRTANGAVSLPDVKDSRDVLRLWKDGGPSAEYFLVENRQRTRFDAALPAEGLLIWHVDESIPNNRDENHYRIALMQADGQRHLERNANRGDGGDPFPGTANNTSFLSSSNPSSKSYAGVDTCVGVTGISAAASVMTATVAVRCVVKLKERPKETKDLKDRIKDSKEREIKGRPKELKEFKDGAKDVKELKEGGKDIKEGKDVKEFKEGKELKEGAKDFKEVKEGKEIFERPGGGLGGGGLAGAEAGAEGSGLAALEARIAALEGMLGHAEPFIDESLRPDLTGGAYAEEGDVSGPATSGGGREDKRGLDTWTPGR